MGHIYCPSCDKEIISGCQCPKKAARERVKQVMGPVMSSIVCTGYNTGGQNCPKSLQCATWLGGQKAIREGLSVEYDYLPADEQEGRPNCFKEVER